MTAGLAMTPLESWTASKLGASGGQMTRKQIECYQLERINETIARVRSLSPFYRRRLAGCGPEYLTKLEEFAGYPLTTANDIIEHAIQMLCVSQSQISRAVTLTTSGTTGNPKRLYFTPFDQELTIDFFRCGMSTLVKPGDRALILLPGERPGSVGDLLRKALQRIGVLSVSYGLVAQLPEAVFTMCQEQANCLVGIPVQVLAMARFWEIWGKSNWAPRCILLSTDYIPAAIVLELKRIWHCEVYEHYGMTEMGLGGGIECAAHRGCHLREADLYFEIVDPYSARSLPDGEYGEVVFTTLTRQGMPLIRYRTGDISRFIPEPCSCGSKLRRLERIRTRKEGAVCFGNDQIVTMADFDEMLFALPDVVNFTVEITYDKIAELKVTAAVLPEGLLSDKSAVLRALRQLPAVQATEQDGRLLLAAEIVREWHLPQGKRAINAVGLTGEV
ncbi:MAG: DVU_1553 family AMP-dependent CoA ligase [Veillonellales bacterium]